MQTHMILDHNSIKLHIKAILYKSELEIRPSILQKQKCKELLILVVMTHKNIHHLCVHMQTHAYLMNQTKNIS